MPHERFRGLRTVDSILTNIGEYWRDARQRQMRPYRESRMIRVLALFLLVALASSAHAAEQRAMADCFNDAGRAYRVPPLLLQAIAWVESRYDQDAAHKNTNGSTDMGVMQINSLWLEPLAQYGIESKHLYNACLNINVGAWILRRQINEVGYNWQAVAQYHSRNSERGESYARMVARVYFRLKQQVVQEQQIARGQQAAQDQQVTRGQQVARR
ncbi:MAG: lytic transglycosylase domain-containing protein [Dongiaceae bacterium]